jgi:PAS domain S-box-containing protein
MIWLLLLKLLSATVSVSLGAGLLARDHGLKANRLIAAFLLCNAWWATSEFFLYQETDPAIAASIFRLMTIGWLPLGVLCMHATVILSSTGHHPISRVITPLYAAIAFVVPIAVLSDLVIAGAVPGEFGWRPLFNPGMAVAYALLAMPVLTTLASWRGVIALPGDSGQLELARIIFFGISGALFAGTFTAVVLPLFGIAAVGLTTTLVALVGLATARTLNRYGHSLISSQALAREILDTLEDGVVLVGEGGLLRETNRAFLEMVGARKFEVMEQPITNWIPEFESHLDSVEASTFLEVRTREGETVPVVASAPVAFRGAGRLIGQAFLLRDRREIVSLQRRLAVSARLAAVGDLSKSISRSINQPIARTRSQLEGLSKDWRAIEEALALKASNAEGREAIDEGFELIEECVEGVDRIDSIVREIGGFSSDTAHENFSPHALGEIITRALRVARAHAPDWLEIEARLDPDVWIDCHAADIERVATNLLMNAIQAFEKRPSRDAHLVVAVGSADDRALLHVEDDGSGIETEILDRVFDPFFTTKPVGKGTGLGLAISYHIVKDHGGEIRISSIRGRGTSMAVEFPRVLGRDHDLSDNQISVD